MDVITESKDGRKYWSVLKTRLKKEGSELATNCSQLKLKASDGKYYKTDVVDIEGMFRMKQFYDIFKNENMSTLWTQLTWSHIRETLVLKNYYEINYYLSMSVNLNLSVRNLLEKISDICYSNNRGEVYEV